MDLNDPTTQLEEELDSEISSIRREIRKLQRRRRVLSSSILSSESLQKRLNPPKTSISTLSSLDEDISPLVRAAGSHSQSNHHRIAFSTTTFPFKDPSPGIDAEREDDSKNLLGVRIDICVRNGRFTKPYYLLLRKVRADTDKKSQAKTRVKVHRHTIPAFIPVERLERIFLPDPSHVLGDSSGNGDGDNGSAELQLEKKQNPPARKQNLQGFVREVRRQLVSWHTRLDAVYLLREQIGVIRRGVDAYTDDGDDGPWDRDVLVDVGFDSGIGETRLKKNEFGIASFAPTALEAAYIRVEWEDGRVGRFKISNSGLVERAVVIGDGGRDKALEATLTGGDGKVLTVLDRLRNDALLRRDNDVASNSE
ncbi:Cenp-O kinetochore centromere component-domain-containing protein [Aspergillus aurantiobrunneus]